MQQHLDQLDLTLGLQIAGLTALKNWMPRKLELIRQHRLAELEAFNAREEEQLSRLQQAESQRQVLVTLIAREIGLEPQVPLSRLAEHLGEPYAERLRARGEQLGALSAAMRESQQQVNELLRLSLDFVHFSMDIFAQLATVAPASGYGGDGDAEMPPLNSWLVDRQA